MMRSFTATWTSVYAGSPSARYDHTNTMAVQGAAPRRTLRQDTASASSGRDPRLKTTLKKNYAIANIVNGLMSQFVTVVTTRPCFFSPTRLSEAKSICSIIG